jgi:hypothetical protein
MTQWHPTDVELAGLSGESAARGLLGHIRGCARCRSVVADYRWLQGEVAETLKSVANEVPTPRSQWREVQGRLLGSRNRQATVAQVSAVVSAAMALCLLLSVPGFLRPSTATQTLQPGVPLRPTPLAVTEPVGVESGHLPSRVSAGPAVLLSVSQESPAPGVQPLPTPPSPES